MVPYVVLTMNAPLRVRESERYEAARCVEDLSIPLYTFEAEMLTHDI